MSYPPVHHARPVYKPGTIPLRPLTLSDMFSGATETIRRNPRATIGIAAVVLTLFLALPMAGTLACGLLGIREKLQPMPAMDHSAQDAGFALPRSLNQALDGLEGCTALQEMLGSRFVRAYVSVKRKEYETFFRVISSWEREFLLLNV